MKLLFVILVCFTFISKAQDIEGKWTGNFIQYIHNTYDVEMTVEKLPPGNLFSAQLRITDGYYYGEYQISGYICQKHNLEISTIILMKENESGGWIDCLNGTWDLNEDENELTFTDTWLEKNGMNNTCKVKYIQKDMFQCLRSSYLRKAKYREEVAVFDKLWNEVTAPPKPQPVAIAQAATGKPDETKINKDAIKDAIADSIKDKNKDITESKDISEDVAKEDVSSETKMDNNSDSSSIVQTAEPVAPPEIRTETKIVARNEDRAPVIDTFEEIKMRPVYARDEIEVSNADITIEYWDRYTEDGDSINLYMNKTLLLENVRLTKTKKIIKVHLDRVKNYLVVDAVNLGTEPPNTASITVKDGKKIQNVSLTSTMKTSGALKITLKK